MTSSPVPQPSRPEPPMAPLSKKVIAWVAAGIATATVVLVVVLWWAGTSGLEGEKLVTARFDALRTGLSIGLGGGGLFALYLAWRRQHSTEIGLAQKQQDQADVARAYELQREDSIARRITDLYTKAVEQLGSEKAPVRLGGLYALERLAQDHVEQRQTIVNVLCAYLRMPYTLPSDPSADDADDQLIPAHRDRTQEREVRLAAQRILGHHLRPGDDSDRPVETFWADIELDLTGAVLINFNLNHCATLNTQFSGAAFIGDASFDHAIVTGNAWFSSATFTGDASFTGFTGPAWFRGATFTGEASFTGFTGRAWFSDATFTGDASFTNANFTGNANFRDATFTGDVRFSDAKFSSDVWFSDANFMGRVWFDAANFMGNTYFRDANFTGNAHFERANLAGNTDFKKATFQAAARFDLATLPSTPYTGRDSREPWIDFRETRFVRGVPPEVARFVQRPGGETG